jgi:uncharacterized protein
LGCAYELGEGVEKDYAEAVRWYRKAAEQGNAFAQQSLGKLYEAGEGVEQDSAEAYKWYNIASAHGDQVAVIYRDSIVEKMTPQQIADGQRRASEFVAKKKE